MELHEDKEQVVACPDHPHIVINWIDGCIRRRLRSSSLYLYPILMKDKHLGTILVFVIVLVILFLIYKNVNLLYVALVFGFVGIFIPWLSRKLHWVWMKFAELLGSVMNKVILSLVYFVFLVPVALVSKIFRKDPFTSRGKDYPTYFTERNFTYTKKSLEDLW